MCAYKFRNYSINQGTGMFIRISLQFFSKIICFQKAFIAGRFTFFALILISALIRIRIYVIHAKNDRRSSWPRLTSLFRVCRAEIPILRRLESSTTSFGRRPTRTRWVKCTVCTGATQFLPGLVKCTGTVFCRRPTRTSSGDMYHTGVFFGLCPTCPRSGDTNRYWHSAIQFFSPSNFRSK